MRGREATPLAEALEERSHLGLLGARVGIAPGAPSADELEVVQIAGRDHVVAALAVDGEDLDRPAPDRRDREQPPPGTLVVGALEVDPSRGDLPGDPHERDRATGGE